ncbi:hypothetical protein P7C73_g4302, partial [Tremellales sp. Uapishka_1]
MDPSRLLGRVNRDAAVDAAAQAEFNEKRRMWVPDKTEGFLAGWIKSQSGDDSQPDSTVEVVIAGTGEVRILPLYLLSPMNPPQFDGVEDIADLTHLNEASVVNDLRMRYTGGAIYTYSGLFLISLNPYTPLPIYTPQIIAQYRTKRREENPPHIFAIAERAWQQIGEERESQSILITGESGAGKTENTKKVIQYLAAIATASYSNGASSSRPALNRQKSLSTAPSTGLPRSSSFKGKEALEIEETLGLLERQILQANPVLEAFGNAQTARNNNSSRFGKFIRIFFSPTGAIAGANIDWYLLEKSRVTARAEGERSFHVFYQLLKGAKEAGFTDALLLEGGPEKYDFLKKTRLQIDGDALGVVGFSSTEQLELFRIPAIILHIGNIVLTGDRSDQAFLPPTSQSTAERVCHLLGIPVQEFMKSVLRPKVRAGREWVTQARTKKQAEDELAALCKFMYEKTFGGMVERINKALDRPSPKSLSIGVLDIAGFEIFVENSYEQLLINFTNEKLQQFFNFHMFTLEQEEYAREGIQWDYVNFGLDLQPTIELIESSMPIGILSCLDEECIMPKATDLTFTEKVQNLWETPRGGSPTHQGSSKFKSARFGQGFVVKHYAGDVEYRTQGWLEKNKDPINDAVARLLALSEIPSIAALFSEYQEDTAATGVVKKVKRGAFRTVGQRHKEQLGQLMQQLSSTQPHFVRCIVPNSEKKPGKVDANLVLDQLRCNGVLEGIRIARLGYPNRHSFAEFRQRYEVLTPGIIPKGYMDGRKAAARMAEALELDKDFYKIGATKIFFKAGILAELEERRDNLLTDMFRRFQAAARMHIARRRINKLINRSQAIRTIQRNARIYLKLRDWPWWSLYVKVRPLLAATRTDDELVKKQAELAMAKERAERDQQEKQRLEELKASLIAEKEKVEMDLSSERQLARDKDAILERSKAREAELLDKISELEADLDVLDSEREEAVLAAEKARERLAQLQLDFEQLVEQAGMLEKEGSAWRAREAELLRDSKNRSTASSKLESEKVELVRVVEDLKREVAQKEDVARRTKERSEMNVAELEKKLQLEKGKLDSGNTQLSTMVEEMRKVKVQYDELSQSIKRHESTIASKEKQIQELESGKSASTKSLEASHQAKAALFVKIDALQSEINAKDTEKRQEIASRDKVQQELDGLRKVMAAKSSEDSKRIEVDRSRETEMSRLREQVTAQQKALDEQRDSAAMLANKLRVDVEGLKSSHHGAQRDLKVALANLKEKESELRELQGAMTRVEDGKRNGERELRDVRDRLNRSEETLKETVIARDELEMELQQAERKFEDLADALISLESEKSDWEHRLSSMQTQLNEESHKRQRYQQELHDVQSDLASHRNFALKAERELAKMAGEIKARDSEIALLRSRENKTIVEHVHVLESAKKVTDRQLAEQVRENGRLNTMLKSLEAQKNRLVGENEDNLRQMELLKVKKSKDARTARASMSNEDKDLGMVLEDERRARKIAQAKVVSLEKDLQDSRRQQSTSSLSSPQHSRTQQDLLRLEQVYESTVSQNQKLQGEVHELQRLLAATTTTSTTTTSRADLLRGLQQSHEAMGKDMSDQLRKLESTPLTPSRRLNTSFSGSSPSGSTLDMQHAKRIRTLDIEINGLRQQLEDEREEKEFLYDRLKELEGGESDGTKPFPFEQAMYSHFRLKAKSLRSQLDHWLAMEDLQQSQAANKLTASSSINAPFTEDVQKLKYLLSQLDPESSPLR